MVQEGVGLMSFPNFLRVAVGALMLAVAGPLAADVVTLSNGDRVTGSILESNEKTLKMKTEFLGEVEIEWSAVTALGAPDKLYVTSGAGQTLVGPVTTEDDKLQVTAPSSGEVELPSSEVAVLRNEEAEQAYLASI